MLYAPNIEGDGGCRLRSVVVFSALERVYKAAMLALMAVHDISGRR